MEHLALNQKGTSKKKLDLIVPAFDPSKLWYKSLDEAFDEISAKLDQNVNLILVNDGSSKTEHLHEGTNLLQNKYGERLHFVTYKLNKGKGFALRQGVAASTADYVIYTDLDFPYTLQSFWKIYECLTKGADVAVGVRDRNYYQHVPALRRWISKILRTGIKVILRIPVDDTQCGLKGFNRKAKEVFVRTQINRFLFDLEFIKLASRAKLKVRPVAVQLKPGVVFSKARINILLLESLNFIRVWLFTR